MILTAIRNKDRLFTFEKVVCSDTDFMVALKLMQTLLRHSQFTYNTIDNGGLSMQDEELIDELKLNFTTKEAYSIGEKFNITQRTMFDKLEQWQRKKIIKRVKKGLYKKL